MSFKIDFAMFRCVALVTVLSFSLSGCGEKQADKPSPPQDGGKAEPSATEANSEPEPVQAVCIYNNLAYWTSPNENTRKQAGYLKKGELVMWLGKTERAKDTNGNERDYYNIRDAEGKETWALADWLVPDSKPAAIVSETTVFDKKSLITKSDFKYQPLDIVAVMSEEDDWVKVVGDRKTHQNWIKPGALTYAEVDIAVANMAYPLKSEKNETVKMEKTAELVKELAADTVLSNSIFLEPLREMLAELQEGEVTLIEVRPIEKKE